MTTADEVGKLSIELEEMQPLLAQAQIETDETMEQIKKDTVIAEETKAVVQKEETEANVKAEQTQAIADDAQRDLDEALPALVSHMATVATVTTTCTVYMYMTICTCTVDPFMTEIFIINPST